MADRHAHSNPDIHLGDNESAFVIRADGSVEGIIPALSKRDDIEVGSPSFWVCVVMALFSDQSDWKHAREILSRKFITEAQAADEAKGDVEDAVIVES